MRNKSLISFILFISMAAPVYSQTSSLWGNAGEAWTPSSRLPDFSHAGYRSGQQPIPSLAIKANVRDFGAKGDGVADDTGAFLSALQSVQGGTVFVPAGRYKITRPLKIVRSQVAIQGEGPGRTILFFPSPLATTVGDGATYSPGGSWSWSGGYVTFEGDNKGSLLSSVSGPAVRGESKLQVASPSRFSVGQRVRLMMTNTDGSLGRHIHNDQAEAAQQLMGKRLVDFSFTVLAVGQNQITMDRPLRLDVRLNWNPTLYSDMPSVEDVGIRDLTFEFPPVPYSGHLNEPGYNGIDIAAISNGWVVNVNFINADTPLMTRSGTKFCTIQNVSMTAQAGRRAQGWDGHHGIFVGDFSQDNLITGFTIDCLFVHDIALSSLVAGNVFADGRSVDMKFDHHRKAPYENLFTNIDAGSGSNVWQSGGDLDAGPPSGARETFWNIRSARTVGIPSWAIQINLIGLNTNLATLHEAQGTWLDAISPSALSPTNLYLSQLDHRLHPGPISSPSATPPVLPSATPLASPSVTSTATPVPSPAVSPIAAVPVVPAGPPGVTNTPVLNEPAVPIHSKNVFNPYKGESADISYNLPEESHVELELYDRTGRKIRMLLNDQQAAGWHKVSWDGRAADGVLVPAGVYVLELRLGQARERKKIVVIK